MHASHQRVNRPGCCMKGWLELVGQSEGSEPGLRAWAGLGRGRSHGRANGRSKISVAGGEQEGWVDVGRGTGELGTCLAREKRPVWGDRRMGLGNWPMDGKPNRPWPLENAGWMVSHN